MKKTFWQEIFIIFVFFILTLWYFKPLLPSLTSSLPDDYDGLLITWSINRMAQNFPQLPDTLFQGNIFYPHPYSHSYSDPFITAGILAKPFLKIIPEPILAFNLNLILSQFFTLYFTYLFLFKLVKTKTIALVLSAVFSFSFIHLHYLPHLHTFSIQFLPLSAYFILNFSQTKKPFWLYAWAGCFVLQMLNSFLPGYFMLFLVIGFYFIFKDLKKAVHKNLNHLLIAITLIVLILFPFINIYITVSKYFHYVRPITEVIHFSLSPEEIMTKFFSPALYLLFLLSNIIFFARKKKDKPVLGFFILTIASIIISLGPALHWQRQTVKIPFHIPLPYILLYFLAPGFKGFRTPSRWILFAGFTAIIFSSLVLKNIYKKHKKLKNFCLFLLFILALITVKPNTNYIKIPQIKDYPSVYFWLKNQKGQNIIELPINAWGYSRQSKQEVYRILYSLVHQKNLVNGYSGYFPDDYYQLVALFKNNFPSKQAIEKLKELKVDYLILHQNEYTEIWQNEQEDKINKLNNLENIKLIKVFGSDLVYQL